MLLGFLLGVVVVLCRPPPQFRRFMIIMTACRNMGNLPIAILGSLCHSEDNPFGPNVTNEYYEIVEEENVESCGGGGGGGGFGPLVVEAEWLLGVDETGISTKPFKDYWRKENDEEIQAIENRTGPISSKMVKKVRLVAEKTPIKNIFQPPTTASMLAIIIGSIPHAKSFVFGRDAPLSFIIDSLEILGGAMVILMSGLSPNALQELSSKRDYEDRIPHFCNML
ncbi:putative membrane transport protein [Helianthus annuus]|nr:putative membrane transport protein [Helianthus annuus]